MPAPKKKENRGGARANTGQKRQTLSARQIIDMRNAAKEMAKKKGQSLYDILLGFCYDDELNVKDRSACIKLYLDKMHIAVSEGGEADKQAGPSIYLPKHRVDNVISIDK